MRIVVSIDDTDNINSRGTGDLAAMLAEIIENGGLGTADAITRHQLLIHEDIPYTSHNSCMCFSASIKDECLDDFIIQAADFLENESAPGSDPGLCVVDLDSLKYCDELIAFGFNAKKIVLNKEKAYQLAHKIEVHLSEHGGTGDGIIGALAGAGLRISGNDGRMRGRIKDCKPGEVFRVEEIVKRSIVELVVSTDGYVLKNEEMVAMGEVVKTVLLEGRQVLLVTPASSESSAPWQTCTKTYLKKY